MRIAKAHVALYSLELDYDDPVYPPNIRQEPDYDNPEYYPRHVGEMKPGDTFVVLDSGEGEFARILWRGKHLQIPHRHVQKFSDLV